MTRKGFTLIELLLVMGLLVATASFVFPVGIRFYQNQVLEDTTENIITTLRRAQSQATFQKNDSAFGVKFLPDSYILFQGDSYTLRDQNEDEVFLISSGVLVENIDEVVFSKLYGLSSEESLTISSYGKTYNININEQGKVELQ